MTTAPAHIAKAIRSPASRTSWPHELILGLLPLIFAAQAFLGAAYLLAALRGTSDFRQLYTGGYLVRTGHAAQLYDYQLQRHEESSLIGGQLMLPINHLAFEELIFAPLSLLPYQAAYWVFFALNLVLLMICVRRLEPQIRALSERWKLFPAFLFAAFYPIARALVLGQDSIIMVALLIAALCALDGKREVTAGLFLGAGIFKFQIVIPIALLFLLWRRWRVCQGFAISSVAAGLLSFLLVGVHGIRQYMDMLLGMSVRLNSSVDMQRYGTIPVAMFNLRGLSAALFGGRLSQVSMLLILLSCSIAIIAAAARQRPSLPLGILAGSLVSYHFLCHDASILIIPIAIALCSQSIWNCALAALLLLAPFGSVLAEYGYLTAIPMLALFIAYIRPSTKLPGGHLGRAI